MPKLVINPGSDAAWEIGLKTGVNTLGRGPDNDVPIDHESVSTTHCQVIVMGRNALLRDVGSVSGTYIDGHLAEEAQLRPGQVFQAGSVEIGYESDEPPGGEEPPPEPGAAPMPLPGAIPLAPRLATSAGAVCKSHPRSPARFACPKCGYHFCELCVSTRLVEGKSRKFCRACGVECGPLGSSPVRAVPREQSFALRLCGAFLYPLRGDGLILLVAGTVLFAILNLASIFAFFVGLFGTGYLVSYLRRILTSSAMGEDNMPDWPDFSAVWEDIVAPCLQWLGTLLACFLPALAVLIFMGHDTPWAAAGLVAAMVYGCVCFPMAFLAVAMFDSIAAVNPMLVIPSIVRIPFQYLLTVLLLGGIFFLNQEGQALLPTLIPIRFVPSLVTGFLSLYMLAVEMRILGLLYLANKRKLGWFKR